MTIEFKETQPNVDMDEIITVFDENEITSFVMLNNKVCRVVDGPAGLPASLLDIEVA